MAPGDVIVLTKHERKQWKGGARRRGNSGMGHTCRCWRRPLEAKVCEQTPAGPRLIPTCLSCAQKIARKYGKSLVNLVELGVRPSLSPGERPAVSGPD